MSKKRLEVSGLTKDEIHDALTSLPKYKYGLKLTAVYLISKGFTIREAGSLLDVSFKQISLWVHALNNERLSGLDDKPKPGRQSKLSNKQKSKLKEMIINRKPSDFGIDSDIWRGKEIRKLIQKKFQITYKQAQVYNIVRSLGIIKKNGKWTDSTD